MAEAYPQVWPIHSAKGPRLRDHFVERLSTSLKTAFMSSSVREGKSGKAVEETSFPRSAIRMASGAVCLLSLRLLYIFGNE